MPQGAMQLTVTAKRKIMKFAEGADPKKDKPYAIEEKEIVLVGDEAEYLLTQMGVNKKEALKMAKHKEAK